MKKISVIMSTHNGRNTIDTAIESILNQTYQNFILIICVDASTDGTYDYLKKKYKQFDNIFIFNNTISKGLANALNLCLKYCKDCEYVARMDDDDYSYSNRFEKQVEFLEKNLDFSFCGTNVDIFDGVNIVENRKLKEFPQKKDLIWNSPFIHPTIMFRYDDLIKCNCYRVSNETLRGQDYDLFMRMYASGYKGANIQHSLFRYTENIKTKKRRTFKVRLGESKVRLEGYVKMGVIWYAFPFVLKPLIAYIKDKLF